MSESQRKKLSRLMWSRVREIISGSELEMHADPLGQRYAVNKHRIIIEGDYMSLLDAHSRLLALLMIEGWILEVRHGRGFVARHSSSPATAYVSLPAQGPTLSSRMDIGVHR